MALYHVHADVIRKGKTKGGATGFAQYIAREQTEKATQYARYIGRDGAPADDLVAQGYGGLPTWAKDAVHFFQMADRHERANGTVARTYEMALPRELSPDQRLELAMDLVETFFEQYPHAWAVHNPIDDHGGEHPHLHVMLSERREIDGWQRGPQVYFARAPHGVRKETVWHGLSRLYGLREGVATLTNAALERAGVPVAVSHRSLERRGYGRAVWRYGERERVARTPSATSRVAEVEYARWLGKPESRAMEEASALEAWHAQREREHIDPVGREAMVDHVRDRYWVRDGSPAREAEREASVWRTIHREHARTGRPLQGPRSPRSERGSMGQALAGLAAALDALSEEGQGRGGRVRLWEREGGLGL